ncbi:mirror-image polydactyly gene 1 protein isoform X2 [Parambassis ranga]|uniref:Mirror-image polydactyly gene 1 protein isoform X2 n=1 Tax=Parambassis ranga TaxID=210632 RepID=A0A6P7H6X9_9TELE|nr:mirror-image polydactyly gene 1 protein isoform X2 [Parambassis ranga]
MYKANPRVNAELKHRLPSPAKERHGSPDSIHRAGTTQSPDHDERPLTPQPLQELQTSCSPSLVSHRTSVSPVSPPSHRRSVSPLSSRIPRGAKEMELSASRGPSPLAETSGDAPDQAAGCPASPVLRRHLLIMGDSQMSASNQSVSPDKNISFLLKELDALREVNNKLQEQLVQREKELQRREVEEELKEEQREAQDWGRPAGLLEKVLAAQKARDQALMSRLLLANEERDEALLRARRLQQAAESEPVTLQDADMDIEELLQRVCDADSAQEVQQFGSVLVQCLQLAQQRRSDITAQEMKAVMEERDECAVRCKRMEQDRHDRQQQASEETLMMMMQRERDGALEDRRRLEAEIRALRANHSSQNTPPSQPSLPGDAVTHHTSSTGVQHQHLSADQQSMEAELKRCQEAEREASERVCRLERLVEVLRKKVGTGSLRAII